MFAIFTQTERYVAALSVTSSVTSVASASLESERLSGPSFPVLLCVQTVLVQCSVFTFTDVQIYILHQTLVLNYLQVRCQH